VSVEIGVEKWVERLMERSPCLQRAPRGRVIARVAAEALAAVDPRACVLRSTHRLIKPRGEAAVIGEFVFDLAADPGTPGETEHGRIWIFGAGKASAAMTAALVERFGERVAGGVVIVKHDEEIAARAQACAPVELLRGDHPVPGPATAAASARLRSRAAEVGPRDLILCPISGGASALLSEPLIAREDWAALTSHLLAREVSIQAINKLRRRFDALKAGGLAHLMSPATVVGLLVSDVVGDELALVGSGPTVYAEGDEARENTELLDELGERLRGLPEALRERLADPPPLPRWPSTPAGLPQGVHQVLIARNGDAREAACRGAQAEGLDSIVLLPALGGLAADEGRRLARLLASPPDDLPVAAPSCLVTGGETVVALDRGQVGVGGRNQELALAAIEDLAGVPDVALLTLATDGEDGPTDAAGALVTGASLTAAETAGLNLRSALATHDSHRALERLGALVRTGPTGTNVCDLALLFRFAPGSDTK
jgi:glycerate 2-kinase